MTLLWGRAGQPVQRVSTREVIPSREGGRSGTVVSEREAMRHSAVWACLRLRANLISTLPVDVYRSTQGIQVQVPTPPVLQSPGSLHVGGPPADVDEWLAATQMDLDRYGNTFGLIVARDGLGMPSRIDLVAATAVRVRVKDGKVTYLIDGKPYTPFEVWHERQYVVPGSPVGLSPIAHSAMAIHQYSSAQEFVQDWYDAGGKPAAHLKNTAQTMTNAQSDMVKARHRATVAAGDVMVTGKDWEYKVIAASANETDFLGTQRFSVTDVTRFYDVPADMIDAPVDGSSITYANVTQRNVQLLVVNLTAPITRREKRLSKLLPAPRFMKLNTGAFMRMDPKTQAEVLQMKVNSRAVTPDEWRALDDQQPLTDEQISLFDRLFGKDRAASAKPAAPDTKGDQQ